MSRKGLSFDEKRKRLSDIFYETKDFFQLKELEKIAPKTKGIVSQSVKEVLQSLVDDNLVISEKIGTSNYFWSFPSTAVQARMNQIERLKIDIETLQSSLENIKESIELAQAGRETSEERSQLEAQLHLLNSQNESKRKEMSSYEEYDPDLFREKKKECEAAKEGANKWIDNIFTLQSFCVNKFMIEKSEFNKQFQIPNDLDYVE